MEEGARGGRTAALSLSIGPPRRRGFSARRSLWAAPATAAPDRSRHRSTATTRSTSRPVPMTASRRRPIWQRAAPDLVCRNAAGSAALRVRSWSSSSRRDRATRVRFWPDHPKSSAASRASTSSCVCSPLSPKRLRDSLRAEKSRKRVELGRPGRAKTRPKEVQKAARGESKKSQKK